MAVAARRASSESEIRLEVHHVVLTFHPPLRLYNLQVLALILEQHGSAPDCRSFVKRGFVIRRKTEIRRLREKSKCLSSVVHFCFDSFAPHPWKIRTEERRKKGTWKNFARNRQSGILVEQECKNRFTGSSHIIGDNSCNSYRKSRTVRLPVRSRQKEKKKFVEYLEISIVYI